jgi:glucose-6-phosphate-specific signal transduction histidine kinase
MMIDDLRKAWAVRPGYWFAPRLFGYGATPVTWQGWALVLGFVALILALYTVLPDDLTRVIVSVVLAVPMVVIAYVKTDGGWRWRWGARD